jgi:hypothetical protein
VLRTDAAGKPELIAMVGGKIVVRAAADKALPTGAWTRLRVESDGKALALWIDGVKAASQATSFRPCDAFPAGAAKRNFLAASRDGSNCFKGVIDYVVFYHSISDDFSKLPPPIRDAPTRPTGEFIAAVEKSYGNVAELNKKIGEEVARRLAPYNELNPQIDAQERELLERSPAYVKAEADLKAVKKAIEDHKGQLQTDMTKKVGQAEAALANANDEAMRPYLPEQIWMRSFRYQAFRGYYNTAYGHYLGDHVKAILGGGEMRENLGLLGELQKSFADGKSWHATVDWEWRTREEIDGKIKDLPLMQKWLLRVRGKSEQ